jgi:drug/metabolite transporter (DMT)-like permease
LLSSSKTIANVRKSQHSFTSLHSQFSSDQEKANERRNGALVLLTVPVAWGSFEPATRFLYATAPELPSLLFSVAYYFVAAVTLLSFTLLTRTSQYTDDKTMQWPVWGGLELGLYLFVGNLLQVLGLRTVPSDRAAFLLQLTTVIVPLLEACRSKQVSSRTWCACLVALLGVGVMGLDSNDSASLASPVRVSNGDIMIGAAAVAYSFHCIRLEKYAQKTSAIQLAASKAVTETMCSFLAILTVLWYASSTSTTLGGSSGGLGLLSTFAVDSGNEIATYVSNHPFMTSQIDFSVIAAICWTGWVTVAYTIYAQSYGQSRVQPTTANLIYTIQPICTSLIAWFLLGESLGPLGWLGGSLIGVAVLLVAMPSGAASTNPDT